MTDLPAEQTRILDDARDWMLRDMGERDFTHVKNLALSRINATAASIARECSEDELAEIGPALMAWHVETVEKLETLFEELTKARPVSGATH